MNIVMLSRIIEITEKKGRLSKLRDMISGWKMVIFVSFAALTLKVAAEQMVMLIR